MRQIAVRQVRLVEQPGGEKGGEETAGWSPSDHLRFRCSPLEIQPVGRAETRLVRQENVAVRVGWVVQKLHHAGVVGPHVLQRRLLAGARQTVDFALQHRQMGAEEGQNVGSEREVGRLLHGDLEFLN